MISVSYDTLMNKKSDRPTIDFYPFLQGAYDHFNEKLFQNKLSNCILILERNNSMGHFSPSRWISGEMKSAHEICLNPSFFLAHPKVVVFQTLVHEMCHLWQQDFGRPGRGRYHNIEWADKMESIGLMPSSTGEPGGKRTGDSMSDYPIAGGAFLKECCRFIEQSTWLPWVDRLPEAIYQFSASVLLEFEHHIKLIPQQESAILILTSGANGESSLNSVYSSSINETSETTEPQLASTESPLSPPVVDFTNESGGTAMTVRNLVINPTKSKYKYTCMCGINFWGKKGINARCEDCNQPFIINE